MVIGTLLLRGISSSRSTRRFLCLSFGSGAFDDRCVSAVFPPSEGPIHRGPRYVCRRSAGDRRVRTQNATLRMVVLYGSLRNPVDFPIKPARSAMGDSRAVLPVDQLSRSVDSWDGHLWAFSSAAV